MAATGRQSGRLLPARMCTFFRVLSALFSAGLSALSSSLVCVGRIVSVSFPSLFSSPFCASSAASRRTMSHKRRCANAACPTSALARVGARYCSRTCGLAVAHARLLQLEAATPHNAAATATPETATADDDNAALTRYEHALDDLARERADFTERLARVQAAPKPPPRVRGARQPRRVVDRAGTDTRALQARMVGARRGWQVCTFPDCGQTLCEVHTDWEQRTATRLWLQFDRTVGRPPRPPPPPRGGQHLLAHGPARRRG